MEKVTSGVNAPTVLTHRKMPPAPTGEEIWRTNQSRYAPPEILQVPFDPWALTLRAEIWRHVLQILSFRHILHPNKYE